MSKKENIKIRRRTLSAVVVDVRVVGVLLDRVFEALERLDGVPLLHVYARELDVTLRERGHELDGGLQIILGAAPVAREEPAV